MTLNQREVEQLIDNNLPMPGHIRHIEGGVTITSAYTHGESWSAIESIGDSLILRKNSQANLQALTSIGFSLYLGHQSKANLPALTSVGGYFYLREKVQVSLPSLISVGGGFYIDEYTEPLPTQLRHLETREAFKLIYQAEDIANQVASSVDISVIKRRAGL